MRSVEKTHTSDGSVAYKRCTFAKTSLENEIRLVCVYLTIKGAVFLSSRGKYERLPQLEGGI